MRKSVHIAVLAIATVGLLLLLLVPHHHHRGVMCLVMSHCVTDNADNDSHTGHSDDGSKCFAYDLWVVSVDNPHAHDGADTLLFPLVATCSDSKVVWVQVQSSPRFAPSAVNCVQGSSSLAFGLRAPPTCSIAA